MNNYIIITLAFILLPFVHANCANAQTLDLQTDETVLEQLEKLKNRELGKDDVCIKRLKEPAEIVVIGLFAKDSGCRYNGVFIDSVYFEKENLEATKKALAAFGWEKADRKQREKLAKLLVEKVLLAFPDRINQTFTAVTMDDGKIKVIVSLIFPPGVTSRNAPKTFVFDKDGGLRQTSDY